MEGEAVVSDREGCTGTGVTEKESSRVPESGPSVCVVYSVWVSGVTWTHQQQRTVGLLLGAAATTRLMAALFCNK